MWDFTVPSGRPVTATISGCDMPSLYASTTQRRMSGRQRRQRGIHVHARGRGVVLYREIRKFDIADGGELAASDFLQPDVHHDPLQPAVESRGTAQLPQRAPGREKDLLRQIITQRRLPAQVVHELAHARLPAAQHLGEGAVVPGARQSDHQGVGRLLQIGDREAALHLACRWLVPSAGRRFGESRGDEDAQAHHRDAS